MRLRWIFAPAVALAAPIHTDLATLRAETATMVIGNAAYDARTGWRIDVDTVLAGGPARAGAPLWVKEMQSQSITVAEGARVVAMVDAASRLRWVGVKVAGPSIEKGVLQLRGFFDFNAHLVTPSLVTLKQLESALRTNALAFDDGLGGTAPSKKRFFVTYDAVAQRGLASGISIPCLDLAMIGGFEWGSPQLIFRDTCPSKGASRELRLKGRATGVDAAGNIELEVSPERPSLSEAEYDAFVRDPTIASYEALVEVKVGGATWKWKPDEPTLIDPAGKAHASSGSSSTVETQNNVTVSKLTESFDGASITLDLGASWAPVVTAVDRKMIRSCTFTLGKGEQPCALTHAPNAVVHK